MFLPFSIVFDNFLGATYTKRFRDWYYTGAYNFSVENSRCFQGIFKNKFKNFKVKVPKHEISNFDQNFTIRERLRDFSF